MSIQEKDNKPKRGRPRARRCIHCGGIIIEYYAMGACKDCGSVVDC